MNNKAQRKSDENALTPCESLSVYLNDWKINQIRMLQNELPSQQTEKSRQKIQQGFRKEGKRASRRCFIFIYILNSWMIYICTQVCMDCMRYEIRGAAY